MPLAYFQRNAKVLEMTKPEVFMVCLATTYTEETFREGPTNLLEWWPVVG